MNWLARQLSIAFLFVTTETLRVIPDGLRALAQRCEGLGDQLDTPLPPVSTPGWQASGAGASTVSGNADSADAALAGRMRQTAADLQSAAQDYESMDDGGAAALASVGAGVSAAGDGGAGAMGGIPFTPLTPRTAGDGGAGGLGMPR